MRSDATLLPYHLMLALDITGLRYVYRAAAARYGFGAVEGPGAYQMRSLAEFCEGRRDQIQDPAWWHWRDDANSRGEQIMIQSDRVL